MVTKRRAPPSPKPVPTGSPAACSTVVFVGDFARLAWQGSQLHAPGLRTVRWLFHIITAGAVWRDPDLRAKILVPWQGPCPEAADVADDSAWRQYQQDPEQAWAARFRAGTPALFPAWWQGVVEADLVVGFELSPSMRCALHAAGRRYVSFHIHALRFLRDLCLGAVTNDPALGALLQATEVPDDEVAGQVHRFKALCAFHRPAALSFPPDLPVLVGQTARDSVLIDPQGRFADWPDHEDALAQHLAGFDACLLLEHPYRADSQRIAEYLRSRHGKAVVSTTANSYGVLLSQDAVPAVLTLASSMGVEADRFGLPVHFLHGDPRQLMLLPQQEWGSTAAFGHGVLSSAFWCAALGRGEAEPAAMNAGDCWARGDHFLRDSLDGWSFQLLRDRLAGARTRTRWLPSARMSGARSQALEAHLLATSQSAGESVQLVCGLPPLQPNQIRVLHGAEPGFAELLGSGFHASSEWGAWSQPGRSELQIPVEAQAGAVLELSLQVRCFEGLLPMHPVLEIMQGGQRLAAVLFRERACTSAQVSVVCRAESSPVKLELHISDGASPSELGIGADLRRLGFGLTQIEVTLRSQAADDQQGLAIWGLPDSRGHASAEPVCLPHAA